MKKEAVIRKRVPDKTRQAIIIAAQALLARDGPEGVSVLQVAKLAGVNRGTAYHHFPDRQSLLDATIESVSEGLVEAVWPSDEERTAMGFVFTDEGFPSSALRLAEFTAQNPAFSKIWLFELLTSEDPGSDPFTRTWVDAVKAFCAAEFTVDGIDSEAFAVMVLMAYLTWPVFMHTEKLPQQAQKDVARRIVREVQRLAMDGVMIPEHFPALRKMLAGPPKKVDPAG